MMMIIVFVNHITVTSVMLVSRVDAAKEAAEMYRRCWPTAGGHVRTPELRRAPCPRCCVISIIIIIIIISTSSSIINIIISSSSSNVIAIISVIGIIIIIIISVVCIIIIIIMFSMIAIIILLGPPAPPALALGRGTARQQTWAAPGG